MYPLVEFPELVKHYAHFYQDVFSAEAFLEFERWSYPVSVEIWGLSDIGVRACSASYRLGER